MAVRRYREGDRDGLARLGAIAFGNASEDWRNYFDPTRNARLDLDGVRLVVEDGGVRASATVLPLEAYVDGRAVPAGGVAAVMTHPAYRRRGHAGELMRTLLGDMRGEGVHLSTLWPFSHAFYRAYGWELAGESIAYSVSPARLPRSPLQGSVRGMREEDLPRVVALLDAEAARHPLCVGRGQDYWRKVLEREGREVAVYDDGGISGYALYEMTPWDRSKEPWRTLTMRELVAATPEAREGLLSFAAAQDPRVFGVRYSAPRGEPLHPFLPDSYVEAKAEPEFMLRIVDVEGALSLLRRSSAASLVLEVADDVLAENAGEYTVGSGEVARGAEAEERVRLDVRRLAQLYAGYLSAEQLARHGALEASSEMALGLLDAFFPLGDPWVFPVDHF
jgi:predicted acetyltransferase